MSTRDVVMGDCHESIGYRSPAAMGRCHECCGGACGGRLSVRDQEPAVGLLMVAQPPVTSSRALSGLVLMPVRITIDAFGSNVPFHHAR